MTVVGVAIMRIFSLVSLLIGLGLCGPFGPPPPDPYCPALPKSAGSPFLYPPLGHQLKMVGLTISTQRYTCNPYDIAGPPRPDDPPVVPLYDLSPYLHDQNLLRKIATKAVFSMAFPDTVRFGKMDWDPLLPGPVMYGGPSQALFFRAPIASYHRPSSNPLSRGLDNEPPLPWARYAYPVDIQLSDQRSYDDIVYQVHTVGGGAPDSCEGLPSEFTRRTASQWYFFYPSNSQGMRGVAPSRQLCKPRWALWR